MAPITLRRQEVDEMREVLGFEYVEGEWESEEAFTAFEEKLARDVIKKSYELFRRRDWFAIGMRVGGRVELFGPEPTENAMRKSAERIGAAPDSDTPVVQLQSVDALEIRLEEARATVTEEERAQTALLFGTCGLCGHLEWQHGFKKLARGTWVNQGTPAGKATCSTECFCPGFEPEMEMEDEEVEE